MKKTSAKNRVRSVCLSGIIAALYVALTLVSALFGLSGGALQLRVSEALCVLPFFTVAAVPGLALGCFLANLITGALWQDLVFGTLATLLGAVGARLLRRYPFLVPLPTVAANSLILPFVLSHAYGAEEGVGLLLLSVGVGEILSAYLLGLILLRSLQKHRIFTSLS